MLEERISGEYVTAMKSRDQIRASTLSFLRAQLKNVLIEKRGEKLTDQDVIAVIKKQIKQRQDSIAQYEQGGRQDLADKEKAELGILKEFLPEEMPSRELEGLIAAVIQETRANSMKDMGKVMKVMTERIQGKADNKLVSDLVKKALMQM